MRNIGYYDPQLTLDDSLPLDELSRLIGADDLEVCADEDVVRPADAHDVDVILAVAHLRNTVDDAPRIGVQHSFRHFIRLCSANDRSRSLTIVCRDLTDRLCCGRLILTLTLAITLTLFFHEGDHL